MRHALLALLFFLPVTAQSTQSPRLVVDGQLTDAIWKETDPGRLISSEPRGTHNDGGEVRAVVAGRYLYVAARLPESSGRFVARLTGRNPSWEEEDALCILVGSHIGYTDRIVRINPLGAYSIEKAVHVTYRSQSVFPYADEWERSVVYRDADRFLIATRREEKAWVVEAAIPLNQLSAPASDRTFVQIERIRASRPGAPEERWHWPKVGPAAKVPVTATVPWDAEAPALRTTAAGNGEAPLEAGRRPAIPAAGQWWDDAAWRNVPAVALLRDQVSTRSPRYPTLVKLVHDGNILSVLAKCTEPGAVVAKVNENDGPVTQDDSFQVYLSTSGSAYAQYAVNAAGYLLDATGFAGGPRLSRAREWNSGAKAAVHMGQGSWQARIDIPLEPAAAALGETSAPSEWLALFARHRPGRYGEPRESSVLPVIESETPLCPARYRRLRLETADPSQLHSIAAVTSIKEGNFDTRVLPESARKKMNLAGMVRQQLRTRVLKVLEAERRDRDQVRTRAEWERFRDPRIRALAASLGTFPQRTSLSTKVTKEFEGHGYRRQDLAYQSRPGIWVTGNLYLPTQSGKSMPGIVIIHSLHRPRWQAELQDMGILWSRLGCAVLIMDQIGYGERLETYPWNREGYHSRYLTGMQLSLVGESLMKWMVWDVMRGVDLLTARPDVNREQIVLMGAVAGGGDPAAVTAALDPRIAAVVPFNFGEATPEKGGGKGPWPDGLADPGWGSWESTRNLPGSIAHQFFPWIIDASVAPRRFLYAYEMGWDVKEQPAWERYRKVFGLYGAEDHLGEAHGFGSFPGPGECANIGPSQRHTIYPYLRRWFNISEPEAEPDDRRPEAELRALTPAIAAELPMRTLHEVASEMGAAKVASARARMAALQPAEARNWLQRRWAAKLGDIEPNGSARATAYWKKPWGNATVDAVAVESEPGIVIPMLLIHSSVSAAANRPVVVAVAEGGKEGFLDYRRNEIRAMVDAGIDVCLPDLRGTGETAPDTRRDPAGQEISLAATEQMLDNTLLGARLKDLRTVLAYLRNKPGGGSERIALWGDAFSATNTLTGTIDEVPGWRVGPTRQHQAEPMGGILALLAGLYEESVQSIVVTNGLAEYASILEDAFSYVPADVIVPGILEAGDLTDVMAAIAPRPLRLQQLVNGRNRPVGAGALQTALAPVYKAYRGTSERFSVQAQFNGSQVSGWLIESLRHSKL